MRFLLGVIALSVCACARGESVKDIRSDSSGAPAGDKRASAMSGAAVPEPTTAEAPPGDSRATVLLVGTSLTAGLGLDPDDAYPAVLQRMADAAGYNVRMVNAGLSGETSAGALRRVAWLLREPAALVLIETGANDGLRGLDVDSTRANLVALVRAVKRSLPSAPVLLVQMEAPPNLGRDYTRKFHDNFPAVAESEGAELVPFLLEGVAGVRKLNQPDGIHPTREGAKQVAKNIWKSLFPKLAALKTSP